MGCVVGAPTDATVTMTKQAADGHDPLGFGVGQAESGAGHNVHGIGSSVFGSRNQAKDHGLRTLLCHVEKCFADSSGPPDHTTAHLCLLSQCKLADQWLLPLLMRTAWKPTPSTHSCAPHGDQHPPLFLCFSSSLSRCFPLVSLFLSHCCLSRHRCQTTVMHAVPCFLYISFGLPCVSPLSEVDARSLSLSQSLALCVPHCSL